MIRQWTSLWAICATLVLSGCLDHKRDVSPDLAEVKAALAKNDDVKARLILQKALQASPGDAQANLLLAKLEDKAGDLQSAIPHYLKAGAVDAHLLEPQLRIADILIDSDRLQDASGRINGVLGSFPGNPDALALRADLLARQGQYVSAATDANAALAKDPGNGRAIAVLATIDLQAGRKADGLRRLDMGLSKHPDDLRLLQVQAAALLTANQPDKAADAFRQMVRQAPRNAAAQAALAELDTRDGDGEGAKARFKAAVEANPGDPNLQFAFIRFLAQHSNSNDVVAYLNDLIKRDPADSTYDLVLASLYRSRGELDISRTILEAAAKRLDGSRDLAPIRVALARLDEDGGRDDRAVVELNSALAADSQAEDALLARADLMLRNGDANLAIADLTKLVRDHPVNGPAYKLLAAAYLARGEPKLATEAMKRAAAVSPGEDGEQIALAAFLEHAGDHEGARDVIARLALQRSGQPLVWIASARLAIDRKDWAAADRALKRLQDLPDTAPTVSVLQADLRAARGDVAGAVQLYEDIILHRDDVDSSTLLAYTQASIAAGHTAAAAQLLAKRASALKGAAQVSAWIDAMSLDAGDEQGTEAAFNNAVKVAPKNLDVYMAYLGVLFAHKQFDRAQTVIQDGLKAGAPRPRLLALLGWARDAAGQTDAALASYRDALALNPLAVDVANNYASIVASAKPNDRTLLEDARQRLAGQENGANPAIIDTIAWLDYRLGRFDEAKDLLTRINAGTSDDPQIRFHLAAVLLKKGDTAAGLALLDTVKGRDFPGSGEIQTLSPS